MGLLWMPMSHAQLVVGEWADRMDREIRQHRTTAVRIIVLQADGKPAVGREVRIEQLSHEFPLGVVLPSAEVPGYDRDAKFWRFINTASLERLTPWSKLQPAGPDDLQLAEVRRAMDWAQSAGLRVHWGGLISAEPAHQPEWVVGLTGRQALDACLGYSDRVFAAFPRQFDSIDLLTHPHRTDWLSMPAFRQFFGNASASAPSVQRRVRFEQAIDDETSLLAAKLADSMRQEFVDFQGVSLHVRVEDATREGPLQRALQRYAFLKLPIHVSAFEAAGDTGLNTSIVTESALLSLFSSPAVESITFDAMSPDTASRPDVALFNADHQPTARAHLIDRFFWQRFRTDTTLKTNDLGTIQTRVFPGRYRLTTVYPDGQTILSDIYFPRRGDPMITVVEPY